MMLFGAPYEPVRLRVSEFPVPLQESFKLVLVENLMHDMCNLS
jgi:hypothetical protein